MLKHINKNDFEKEVLENKKIVLVDFFAAWCGPCNMISPILEEVAKKSDDFDIIKINIDENQELASRYAVEVIPTLLVFKDGVSIDKRVGLLDENEILDLMKKHTG